MPGESDLQPSVTRHASSAPATGGPPRFQFRVWGDVGEAAGRLRSLGAPHRVEHRRDIYLLGTRSHHNVKVRAQRLEISELLGIVDGFEQWNRAAIHRLPCTTGDVRRSLREVAGFDGIDELTDPVDERLGRRRLLDTASRCGLLPVAVAKHRERFVLGALRAEVTTMVLADGGMELACVAFEGPEPASLVALRGLLGLEQARNMAVPVALEQALRTHAA